MADPDPTPADLIALQDFEAVARQRLPKMVYDYYASGAHDEHTLGRNRQAWNELSLHYNVLVDVSARSTQTTVLGRTVSMPVLAAPTAFHGLAHPHGERASARGIAGGGTVMLLSTLSTAPVEEVVREAEAGGGAVWMQLYVYRDRAVTADLVARVQAAGVEAIVLTVDAPVLGTRERDVRNRFHLPEGIRMENLVSAGFEGLPALDGASGLAGYVADLFDPSLSWDDIEWIRGLTSLPVLVKGVVRPDDAVRAVERGAAGVVVSNHGGRQLDTAPATAQVLGPVAEAVDGRAEIYVDGGIRRGTDVVKAVALGAQAVLIGRPLLWGLAADGAAGVTRVLDLLRAEVDLAMALSGRPTVGELTPDLLTG